MADKREKKNPLISVVIPVYNVEKYLCRSIDSVVQQTYKNLEIILVDDGSTDGCPEICDEYAKKDNRIKVIHKENGGLSDARNAGIREVHGSYVGFVDSDDWIALNMYENLLDLIEKAHADIAVCGVVRVEEEKEIMQPNKRIIVLNQKEYIERYFKINSQVTEYYAWNKLYKVSLLSEDQYPKGLTAEDVFGTYKAILKADKIVLTNQMYYYYYYNANSITGHFSNKVFDQIEVWDKVVEYTKQHAPEYLEYAELNRKRAPLNILHRCSLSESTSELRKNKKVQKLLKELKKNEKFLLRSPIRLSRKIAIFLYCRNYFAFSKFLSMVKFKNA